MNRDSISLLRTATVFLSSTSDLATERDAIVAKLRRLYDVYDYRDDLTAAATGQSPEERLKGVLGDEDRFGD